MIMKKTPLVVLLTMGAFGASSTPIAFGQTDCFDDPDFRFKNDETKDCNWVGRNTLKRCERKWKGKNVHQYCSDVCGKCSDDDNNNGPSCTDDPKFKFNNEKRKDCSWVGLKPNQRCSREWKGIKLSAYCPEMCNACPEPEPVECEDDSTLQYRNDPKRGCKWVEKQKDKRCGKPWNGKKLEDICPVTCNTCEVSNPDVDDNPVGGKGCCSLDYKECIGWCGPTKESCESCNHHDGVGWLENGPPQGTCKKRWKGCANAPEDCCPGLTCREDANNYLMCLPTLISPTTEPTLSPTPSPTEPPTISPSSAPSSLPSDFPTEGVTTDFPTSEIPTEFPTFTPTIMDSSFSSSTDSTIPTSKSHGPCCSLDYKTCIDWCGTDFDSCATCNHHDGVFWLDSGPPEDEQCLNRWTGCEDDANACCNGLTCRENDNNFLMCLPLLPPFTSAPTEYRQTNSPTISPTNVNTDPPTLSPTTSPTGPPTNSVSYDQTSNAPTMVPTASPQLQVTRSPSSFPTSSPSEDQTTTSPSVTPTNPPQVPVTNRPTDFPTLPQTSTPVNNSGCCSLDYKNCVDWCGSDFDSCTNCGNSDVAWLPNGEPDSQCGERWTGCDENNDTGHNGCCAGLSCQWRSGYNYMACLPNLDPTFSPVPPPPTDPPTVSPTVPREPTISPAPTPQSSLLSTDKAMNAWDVYLGLDYITHKNSVEPPNYALVASGGAAGSGNLVVSESQAYGLLITGTVLASWRTHAGKVPNSRRPDVLKSFEGYFNFWVDMNKNSSNKGSNCQPGGNYCRSSSGSNYVCLPDWRHYKTGGSEATGPAPDADEDAIVGIILAVKAVENDENKPVWYETARKWADASATAFFEFEVDKSKSNHRLVKLGSCWGGWEGQGNNPSYHSPGSFRVMRDYQKSFPDSDRRGYSAIPEDDWNKLINTSHEVLRAVQCSNKGALVPNWATIGVDNNGDIKHTGGGFSGSGTPQYEYGAEAARTTFRVALDAAFYPEMSSDWSPYLNQFNERLNGNFQNGHFSSSTFPSCRGPNTNQNINIFGGWQSNAFIYGPTYSSLIAASSDIGNASAMIDAAGQILGGNALPGSYYPRSWAMISNLMLNGAMESAGNTLKS